MHNRMYINNLHFRVEISIMNQTISHNKLCKIKVLCIILMAVILAQSMNLFIYILEVDDGDTVMDYMKQV